METEVKTKTKKGDIKTTPIAWKKSWTSPGPLIVPEEVKDHNFCYGWINYNEPGRLQAACLNGWQIDKEVLKVLGSKYEIPNISFGTPIEGALVVGNSMLMRIPKERKRELDEIERAKVISPEKAAKNDLKDKLGSSQVYGEVSSSIM